VEAKSERSKFAAALLSPYPLDIIGSMNSIAAFSLYKLQLLLLCIIASIGLFAGTFPSAAASDPWMAAQTVQPAQLVAELQQEKDPHVLVIYVGMRTLYNGGHIPGAVFYGPGSTEQGIADLKKYAATVPKNSDVVLYCGCCPLEKCPNLRPAFTALKEMGFSRLRVLLLPTSFNTDWVEKGYPVKKGSSNSPRVTRRV
jgi:thiosulfate/3-mercaptopyruvate sulfurtransferase